MRLRRIDKLVGENRHSSVSQVRRDGSIVGQLPIKALNQHALETIRKSVCMPGPIPGLGAPSKMADTRNSAMSSTGGSVVKPFPVVSPDHHTAHKSHKRVSDGWATSVPQKDAVRRSRQSDCDDELASVTSASVHEEDVDDVPQGEVHATFSSTIKSSHSKTSSCSDSDSGDEYNIYGDAGAAPLANAAFEQLDDSEQCGLTIILDNVTRGVLPKSWEVIRNAFQQYGARGVRGLCILMLCRIALQHRVRPYSYRIGNAK